MRNGMDAVTDEGADLRKWEVGARRERKEREEEREMRKAEENGKANR